MNLDFSPEDEAFRDQVRTWLAEHAPTDPRPRNGMAMRQFDMGWLHQLWEAGWSGISWPVEYGGRGLPLAQQLIWHEEYARTGLPDIDSSFVGLNHAGPTPRRSTTSPGFWVVTSCGARGSPSPEPAAIWPLFGPGGWSTETNW